ncbi:MAG TPA: hypothetical protein VLX28_08655 [Thermoanaerobaculia bacterium]|nr:hypothetical protein [Thermoanaerobaculia bacterium]
MKPKFIEPSKPSVDAPEIAEVRAIRAAISAECDHDPWKLVARMRDFQIPRKQRRYVGDAAKMESKAS